MNFKEKAFAIIRQIPAGTVASYGQIAALIDSPRAARQVGWMLATVPAESDLPWWRVVNKKGYLSIRNDDIGAKLKQKELLEAEGVEVNDEFCLNMNNYQWQQ